MLPMSTAHKALTTESDIHLAGAASALSIEFNDAEYTREVLQLGGGVTEDAFDKVLSREAEMLVINFAPSPTLSQDTYSSMCESAITATSRHARTTSSESLRTVSTGLTSRSSMGDSAPSQMKKVPTPRRRLSFSRYDLLAVQTITGASTQTPADSTTSLFSVTTRRSFSYICSGVKNRFRLKRTRSTQGDFMTCIGCKGDFKLPTSLHTLPCMHNYCDSCLQSMLSQACTKESKMPPRCCDQPVPTSIIKTIYSHEDQHIFMAAVLLYTTPRSLRIFCPNQTCGEFIPLREKIDPKHPFDVVCRKCRTRVCSVCKKDAHGFGGLCPSDREYDSCMQREGSRPLKRCYNCRELVDVADVADACDYISCRCNAELCYTCGAVWDTVVGCPNYCNSEEELERRRLEKEERIAALGHDRLVREETERQEAAEKMAAEQRTSESEELKGLRATQIKERDRFCAFEKKMRFLMFARHGQTRVESLDRHARFQAELKEKHAMAEMHLEDRQVAAEMELRDSLEQTERSVTIRLRHMEAYCDGLGRAASGPNPARVVTERDLRELGQVYNTKDDMERLHQSKINVMRDKQAKQMEQLIERQDQELEKLVAKHAKHLEAQELSFVAEDKELQALFLERKRRLSRRWDLAEVTERKNLEAKVNLTFAPMALIEWPDPKTETEKGGLDVTPEVE